MTADILTAGEIALVLVGSTIALAFGVFVIWAVFALWDWWNK